MGYNDHITTENDFAAIAIEAKAIETCPVHPDVTIDQGDPEANRRAYAIATNRWKKGDLLGTREEIMAGIKDAIESSADECPACAALKDA